MPKHLRLLGNAEYRSFGSNSLATPGRLRGSALLLIGLAVAVIYCSRAATIPGAPQNLSASAGCGQVSLAWSAPSSNDGPTITSYKVFRDTNNSKTQLVTSGGCATLMRSFSATRHINTPSAWRKI